MSERRPTSLTLGDCRARILAGELRRHPELEPSPENLRRIAQLPRLQGWPLAAVERAYDQLVAEGLLVQDASGATFVRSSHDRSVA